MATTPLPLRALLTVAALAALTVACTPRTPTEPTQDTTAVNYVLDGDTIEVTDAAGSSQRVRLLGTDPTAARLAHALLRTVVPPHAIVTASAHTTKLHKQYMRYGFTPARGRQLFYIVPSRDPVT